MDPTLAVLPAALRARLARSDKSVQIFRGIPPLAFTAATQR